MLDHGCHRHQALATSAGLVANKVSCPVLNRFKVVDVLVLVGVLDVGTIFYFGMYHGLVGLLLQVSRAHVHVPPEKTEYLVGCIVDVVNVLVPSEPVINLDPQVIYSICGTHNRTIHEILVGNLVLGGVGDGDALYFSH